MAEEGVEVTVGVEIFLRGREDSRLIQMVALLPDSIETVDELVHSVTHLILGDIDTVGATRMVLLDDLGNTHIILIDQLQSLSVYAPDALPEGFNHE